MCNTRVAMTMGKSLSHQHCVPITGQGWLRRKPIGVALVYGAKLGKLSAVLSKISGSTEKSMNPIDMA